MKQQPTKKQFSLSLTVRIVLAVIITVSVVIFAASIMQYNQLLQEEAELQEEMDRLKASKEELLNMEQAVLETQEIGAAEGNNSSYSEKLKSFIVSWMQEVFGYHMPKETSVSVE